MAPLYEAARDFYSDTGFFIALAGLAANIIVFGTLCFPSKLEIYTQEKKNAEIDKKTKDGQSGTWPTLKFYLQSKKISNDQELIQSDPISCPQNRKGNN